jgi:hypothetical protein
MSAVYSIVSQKLQPGQYNIKAVAQGRERRGKEGGATILLTSARNCVSDRGYEEVKCRRCKHRKRVFVFGFF